MDAFADFYSLTFFYSLNIQTAFSLLFQWRKKWEQWPISPTCLHEAFTGKDHKSIQRQRSHKCLFALLVSAIAKAACKILVKATQRVNFTNTFGANTQSLFCAIQFYQQNYSQLYQKTQVELMSNFYALAPIRYDIEQCKSTSAIAATISFVNFTYTFCAKDITFQISRYH